MSTKSRWPTMQHILRNSEEPAQTGSYLEWEEAGPTVESIPEGVQRKYDAIKRLIQEHRTVEEQVAREVRKLESIKADIDRFRGSLSEDLVEIGMVCRTQAPRIDGAEDE